MTVWFKQGVMGHLTREAQKGFGKVAALYANEGYKITSIQEGNHDFGSFHFRGDAWDAKKGGVSVAKIRAALSSGIPPRTNFDVVGYNVNGKDYVHIEYDPK